ncbi:leukocyte immunoglobulin-like receptor subfamily A member 6 isoform X2 [Moschus berezovskii]|uniref:leukocyte immunoglobulin-like receptor subfamily A member 6 isoform X2 n=1 Tax=Moschus berezovskii TaxID=68408 RepID=UPI002443FC6A|nr:leukocyte immunoglobulin-like receptor subfamily A member 6 isoform X2 [Moschus berezovskii]
MSAVPPSLLCLGLCLSQSTWAQKGSLPPPRITALPGSTVPQKSPVTLLCQGPKRADGYKISKVGSPEPLDKEEETTPRKTNILTIAEMTVDKTGLYHCSYQRGGRWSQFSDPLQLVMTGDGNHTQNQNSAPQDGRHQSIFLLNPVSPTQAGTYRCYGAFHQDPYVWSGPSDPLQLQVEGTTDSPSSTQPRRSPAPSDNLASRDRLLGVWIGVPVAAGLLLLVFPVFLTLYCLRKAKINAARKERHAEAAGRASGQGSEAADPQEVTYSQVTCRVPPQGTAGTPSWVPRQTHSSEYVTLAFR